jgi:hypothetical protein
MSASTFALLIFSGCAYALSISFGARASKYIFTHTLPEMDSQSRIAGTGQAELVTGTGQIEQERKRTGLSEHKS